MAIVTLIILIAAIVFTMGWGFGFAVGKAAGEDAVLLKEVSEYFKKKGINK